MDLTGIEIKREVNIPTRRQEFGGPGDALVF
jgi:hypothetical protein